MKQTKEELIGTIAKLEKKVKILEEGNDNLRLEVSKALGAPTYKESTYSSESKQTVYSWQKIFVELGKLLERKKQADLEKEVADLRESHDQLFIEWRDWLRDHSTTNDYSSPSSK